MELLRSKRGQLMLFGIMLAIMMIAFAIITIPVIKEMISNARSDAGLDCSNTSISTGTKMTCIAVDLVLPYFIIVVIFGGIGYIGVRKLSEE